MVNIRKHKLGKSKQSGLLFTIMMVALPMLQFIIFWGYVNFDSILMAFRNGSTWTLMHFKQFFEDWNKGYIPRALTNSLINLLVNEFISLPIVVVLSYFLFKKCYGSKVFRVLFFIPSLISAVVMAYLFQSIIQPDGDAGPLIMLLQRIGFKFDGELGKDILFFGLLGVDKTAYATIQVYCIWTCVGTNLVLLSGALARSPQELFEAAKIDGAGMWAEFKHLVIPILWPTITTLFIFNLAACFTMYLPVTLLGGSNMPSTWTIGYLIVQRTNEAGKGIGHMGYPAAIGLIFTAVTVPLILIIKKVFNRISEAMEF